MLLRLGGFTLLTDPNPEPGAELDRRQLPHHVAYVNRGDVLDLPRRS